MIGTAFAVKSDLEKQKELCRKCFVRKPTCLNVFETSITYDMTMADMFMEYLGENMYPDDDLPKFICCDCILEVVETENITDEVCKTAVKHIVWRTRLLEMEFNWRKICLTKQSYMKTQQHFFTEGNRCIRMKIRVCSKEPSSTRLTSYKQKFSCEIDNCEDKVRNGAISEMHQKNCMEPSFHECSTCRGLFLSEKDLINHKSLFHEVSQGYPCGKCHKRFETRKKLERHIEKYSFMCQSKVGAAVKLNIENSFSKSCDRSSSLATDAEGNSKKDVTDKVISEVHQNNFLETCVYECNICRGVFLSEKNLISHKSLFHEVSCGFPCGKCHKKFKTRKKLERHIEKYSFICKPKGDVAVEENSFAKSSDKPTSIAAEMEENSKKDVRYTCAKCNCSFESSEALIVHLREIHSSNTPFHCRICCLGFVTRADLALHKYLHPKEYSCDLCKREFHSQRGYQRHIKCCKEKSGVYKCPICGKELYYKWQISRHLNTHVIEKKFECNICCTRFRRNGQVLRHMRAVHLKLKPHKCDLCHKSFSWRFNLEMHYASHSDERPHKCSFCGRDYKRKINLRYHEKNVHKCILKPRSNVIVEESFSGDISNLTI